MCDIFISHATKNDDDVTRIHNTLQAAGLDVWVDHIDGIGPGDRWPQQIQVALNDCTAGLVVLSPDAAESPEVEAEYRRILQLGKRLYIALLRDVPLADFPFRLTTIQYVDLRKDYDAAMAQLIAAIKNERGLDPTAAVVGQIRRVSSGFPRSQLDLPLIGRDDELAAVLASLRGDNRVTTVTGLGGVGKTRLAAEVVQRVENAAGVVWHTIQDYTTVTNLTDTIRDHLQLAPTTDADAVWHTAGQRDVLIVLDNAEECRSPAAYAERINRLDTSNGCRVLMTSRAQWREFSGAKVVRLSAPLPERAVEILRAMVAYEPPTFSLDGHDDDVAREARYHPRLMRYAVRWLNTYPVEYVREILQSLKGADAEEALTDMVGRTIERVKEQADGENALNGLRRLAVCRGGFTFDAARALLDDPRQLALLQQWGLVNNEGGRFDIDDMVLHEVSIDETARRPHYDYYLALADEHHRKQDYLGLDIESANLEAAFEWAMRVEDYEAAYWLYASCRHFFPNRGRFEQRMNWLMRVSQALENHEDESLKANVQNDIGILYGEHPLGDRADNLRRAIAAYREALRFYTAETAP
ncbi:MAG: TIR domain-containing protein, partial [Chloroflexi bacterium]